MKRLWAAIVTALPGLAAAGQPALTADSLRRSCAVLADSPYRQGSEACRHYLEGFLAGASAARVGGTPPAEAGWESRAARTRLGPRARRSGPGTYCLPEGLAPEQLARALLDEDVHEAQGVDDWVEAALRRRYPCGKP